MQLSEYERGQLDGIGGLLAVSDPKLASRLSSVMSVGERRMYRIAVSMMMGFSGAIVIVVGAIAMSTAASVGILLVVAGGALWVWATVIARELIPDRGLRTFS